jgi:glycine cleavage system H lipoate-binding protein
MIVREPAAEEKCSQPAYTNCATFRQCPTEAPAGPPCPYLEERRAEYCAAAPVARFVPQTEAESRCRHDSHRYCPLFLGPIPAGTGDELTMPGDLYYSPNHLWLDVSGDGSWHVGIDALLAKAIGCADGVTFVTLAGTARPAAILDVKGLHFEVVFPNPLEIGGANLHLRADPSGLTADPYGIGWLFEGRQHSRASATRGLMRGHAAVAWMRRDVARIAERAADGTMADGGVPCEVLRRLERDRALPLFHELFSLARVGSGQ